jgi:hypothetical protein
MGYPEQQREPEGKLGKVTRDHDSGACDRNSDRQVQLLQQPTP